MEAFLASVISMMFLATQGASLTYTNVGNSSISQIPSDIPNDVQILDLSANNITRINNSDLQQFNQLSHLNLRTNKISYIGNHAFYELIFLIKVDLTENELTETPNIYDIKDTLIELHLFCFPYILQRRLGCP